MHKLIYLHVEGPGFFEEEYYQLPPEWDSWTEEQRTQYCTNSAVDMQNNVAPCGGEAIEVSDERYAELERDRRVMD